MENAQTAKRTTKRRKRSRKKNRRLRPPANLRAPALRFSPYAWAKLLFLRDQGESEVGGFGITSRDDLLLVEDVQLVQQCTTPMSVRFDDAAVADFFDQQVDADRQPVEFARIWVHTHPGSSARPSNTDEETFVRCFGRADWSIMFVLARGGQTYARVRFGVGPGGSWKIPVEVDCGCPFPAADHAAWEQEYARTVQIVGDPLFRLTADEFGPWDLESIEAETGGFREACSYPFTEDLISPTQREDL